MQPPLHLPLFHRAPHSTQHPTVLRQAFQPFSFLAAAPAAAAVAGGGWTAAAAAVVVFAGVGGSCLLLVVLFSLSEPLRVMQLQHLYMHKLGSGSSEWVTWKENIACTATARGV
jgi:hypothetical protein